MVEDGSRESRASVLSLDLLHDSGPSSFWVFNCSTIFRQTTSFSTIFEIGSGLMCSPFLFGIGRL